MKRPCKAIKFMFVDQHIVGKKRLKVQKHDEILKLRLFKVFLGFYYKKSCPIIKEVKNTSYLFEPTVGKRCQTLNRKSTFFISNWTFDNYIAQN